MRADTKRAIGTGVVAGAVLEHELSGHGVLHVDPREPGEPFAIVTRDVMTDSGTALVIQPEGLSGVLSRSRSSVAAYLRDAD